MNAGTSPQHLRAHVYRLAEEIGERNVRHPKALHAAESYIRQVWKNQGFEVVDQRYTVRGVDCANLEVTRWGTEHPDEIILLGAHYDSVTGSPGANDNGSGVASLLELSRLFSEDTPARTIRFVAFVNEEPPFFFIGKQGSRLYAQAARKRGDDVRLMISLETMGYYRNEPGSQHYPPLFRYFYPKQGNFIALVSNFRSRHVMHRLAKAFRSCSDFPLEHLATSSLIPGVGWSDHFNFWRQGYRALMVTDTAFYRYPFYHRAEDTAEKNDYDKLARVTDSLHQAILLLAAQGLS